MLLRLVGIPLYVIVTKTDIAFSVQYLSQFLQEPKESYWIAPLRVVKYIRKQPRLGLFCLKTNNLGLMRLRLGRMFGNTKIGNMLLYKTRKLFDFVEYRSI